MCCSGHQGRGMLLQHECTISSSFSSDSVGITSKPEKAIKTTPKKKKPKKREEKLTVSCQELQRDSV